MHTFGNIYIDTANGINYLFKRFGINDDIMVDFYAKEVFNSILGQLLMTIGVGSIYFVKAVSFYFDSGITRYG